jgi:hypothetical protein
MMNMSAGLNGSVLEACSVDAATGSGAADGAAVWSGAGVGDAGAAKVAADAAGVADCASDDAWVVTAWTSSTGAEPAGTAASAPAAGAIWGTRA